MVVGELAQAEAMSGKAGKTASGLKVLPSLNISICVWGPEVLPVKPTSPIVSFLATT